MYSALEEEAITINAVLFSQSKANNVKLDTVTTTIPIEVKENPHK